MKKLLLLLFIITLTACGSKKDKPLTETDKVNKSLDAWHKAAAEANFNNYFEAMTEDAIFIGTDATENWNKTEFQAYAKPYFDKGQAWSFTASNRNWNFSANGKVAWFDEDLDTWMRGCRGTGVLVKKKGNWMISHYNLTVLIENEKMKSFIELRDLPLE